MVRCPAGKCGGAFTPRCGPVCAVAVPAQFILEIVMKPSTPLFVTGAAALALLALVAASLKVSSCASHASERAFSSRFQPTMDLAAGIGSTRDLQPVPLDPPHAAPLSSGGDDAIDRGHHGPGRPRR